MPLALAAAFLLSACIPASGEPTAAPAASVNTAPVPAASPAATAPPVAAFPGAPANWEELPSSPGDWFYASRPPYSYAAFGKSEQDFAFTIRCERTTGTVSLGRVSAIATPQPMRILAESAARAVTAQPRQGSVERLLAADLAAHDPLLDAIAISKGRFAIEVAGTETLYLPSWTEVTRVIEDCR